MCDWVCVCKINYMQYSNVSYRSYKIEIVYYTLSCNLLPQYFDYKTEIEKLTQELKKNKMSFGLKLQRLIKVIEVRNLEKYN